MFTLNCTCRHLELLQDDFAFWILWSKRYVHLSVSDVPSRDCNTFLKSKPYVEIQTDCIYFSKNIKITDIIIVHE